ncbi:TetR/AcrR family transcriptional regulator [Kitasatospora sp. NPDC050543]|uniref:TetR/AcrR family transcriptional regulator n=1 Tax=Kitasatospora sp. NPDC050543 TaxID=3364054 RepID=UPI00379B3274
MDDGTPLQLNDVAHRAQLGVGTVYRHFPTAEALLETVATPCLETLAAHGEQAPADGDPWRALAGLLARTVEAQVTDASLSAVTAAPTDALARTTELKRALWSVGGEPLERARDARAVI